MIEITKKLKLAPAARKAYGLQVKGHLTLPFEFRQKSRVRIRPGEGEEIALMLPRGEVLRGGDLVVASDGSVIEVVAAPEPVLHITCASSEDLARAAYHLGNRHVPVEVGEGHLRILADHVLEKMLRGLGAMVQSLQAPFEPEAGAYTAGGTHQHPEAGLEVGGARIHEFGQDEHKHQHGHAHGQGHEAAEHVHGPDCGHDHGHHDHGHKHQGHDHGHQHEDAHAPAKPAARSINIPVKSAPVHVHGPDCDHGHGHDHDHGHDHEHAHAAHAHVEEHAHPDHGKGHQHAADHKDGDSHAGKIFHYSETHSGHDHHGHGHHDHDPGHGHKH